MDYFVAINIGQNGNGAFPGNGDYENREDGCAAERDMAYDGFAVGGVLEYSPFDEETDTDSGQTESYTGPGCMGIGAEESASAVENQMLYQSRLQDSDSPYAATAESAEISGSDGAVEYASIDCGTYAEKYVGSAPEAMEEGTEYGEPTSEAMGEQPGYGKPSSEAMGEETEYGKPTPEAMGEETGYGELASGAMEKGTEYGEPTPEAVEERLECDESSHESPEAKAEQEKKEAEEEEERKRAEHEAAEAKRKAEWDAAQQAKKDAREAQLARIRAMGDEELAAEAMKRIGADTEKLTRRRMPLPLSFSVWRRARLLAKLVLSPVTTNRGRSGRYSRNAFT